MVFLPSNFFINKTGPVIDGTFADIEKGAEAEMDRSLACKKNRFRM